MVSRYLRPEGLLVPGVGAPSGVFRFAGHMVLGTWSSYGMTAFNAVSRHEILQQPPFNPNILRAEAIVAKWGRIAFYWNFALWIPTIFCPGLGTLVIGAFDLFLTVQMGIAVVLQSGYIPRNGGPCNDADNWQVTGNMTKSFFYAQGATNATRIPADKICRGYVEEWKYGVASLVLYSLVSFFNIGLALLVCWCVNRSSNRNISRPSWRAFAKGLACGLVAIPFLLFVLLKGIAEIILSCFPIRLQRRFNFGLRFVAKTFGFPIWFVYARVPTPQPIDLQDLKSKFRPKSPPDLETAPPKEASGGSSTALAEFLHIDILMLVSEHLHHQDMLNLSLTSKQMRQVIYPTGEEEARAKLYKKYTCEGNGFPCWSCRTPICMSCERIKYFSYAEANVSHTACKPCCSKCLQGRVLRLSSRKLHECGCDKQRGHFQVADRSYIAYSTVAYQVTERERFRRHLCSRCASRDTAKLVKMRLDLEKKDIRRGYKKKEEGEGEE
ncbi:hypothetical protein AJ80_09782, partial [Polytolypa hystricis UAMH7299]